MMLVCTDADFTVDAGPGDSGTLHAEHLAIGMTNEVMYELAMSHCDSNSYDKPAMNTDIGNEGPKLMLASIE